MTNHNEPSPFLMNKIGVAAGDDEYHGVDQMAVLLVLMHAYPSAYAYWVDYVLFTLPPDYAYLSLLMVSYGCLCMLMYVCLFAYGL
jgi:hypothetical protein